MGYKNRCNAVLVHRNNVILPREPLAEDKRRMCMLYFKFFRRFIEEEPSDVDVYKFLLYLFAYRRGRDLTPAEIQNYIDNPEQYVLSREANAIIERFNSIREPLRDHTVSPKSPSRGGDNEKEYITYNAHKYVVRKEKNRKYIVSKRETIYLSDIRGQYVKC